MPSSLLQTREGAALFGSPGGSGRAPGWVSGGGWQGRGAARGGGSPGPSVGITRLPVPLPAPPRQHLLQKQEIAYY